MKGIDGVHTAPLTDDALDEAMAFMKVASPFSQYAWGWDTGRFVDFRWAGNASVRAVAEPGFFERHGTLVRSGDDVVALVLAEEGAEDHCILTASEDPDTLEWALRWLVENRPGERLVLYPCDDAAWVHEVIALHGFVRGEQAGLEWGFDLGDVPELFEPEGFAVDFIRGPEDYAGISRCIGGAFGGNRDVTPTLESLATNPMYVPELSVLARAENGDIAAYCRGTVDADNGIASIDPVATHPDYQRRGLGKAVVLKCFAEQRRLGGTMSFIGSGPEGSAGSGLYRSLNPASMTPTSEWSRPA